MSICRIFFERMFLGRKWRVIQLGWLLGVFGPAKDRAMSSLPGDTEGSTSPGELLHRIRQQRGTLDLRICWQFVVRDALKDTKGPSNLKLSYNMTIFRYIWFDIVGVLAWMTLWVTYTKDWISTTVVFQNQWSRYLAVTSGVPCTYT